MNKMVSGSKVAEVPSTCQTHVWTVEGSWKVYDVWRGLLFWNRDVYIKYFNCWCFTHEFLDPVFNIFVEVKGKVRKYMSRFFSFNRKSSLFLGNNTNKVTILLTLFYFVIPALTILQSSLTLQVRVEEVTSPSLKKTQVLIQNPQNCDK